MVAKTAISRVRISAKPAARKNAKQTNVSAAKKAVEKQPDTDWEDYLEPEEDEEDDEPSESERAQALSKHISRPKASRSVGKRAPVKRAVIAPRKAAPKPVKPKTSKSVLRRLEQLKTAIERKDFSAVKLHRGELAYQGNAIPLNLAAKIDSAQYRIEDLVRSAAAAVQAYINKLS